MSIPRDTILLKIDRRINPFAGDYKPLWIWLALDKPFGRPIILLLIAFTYGHWASIGALKSFLNATKGYEEILKNIIPLVLVSPFAFVLWWFRNKDKQIELQQKDEELKQKSEEWEHIRRVDHKKILHEQFDLMVSGSTEADRLNAAIEIKLYLEGHFGEESLERCALMLCNILDVAIASLLNDEQNSFTRSEFINYSDLPNIIDNLSSAYIEGLDQKLFSWIPFLTFDQLPLKTKALLLDNKKYVLADQYLHGFEFTERVQATTSFFRMSGGKIQTNGIFFGVYLSSTQIVMQRNFIHFTGCYFNRCKIDLGKQTFGVSFKNCVFDDCDFKIHPDQNIKTLSVFFKKCLFSAEVIENSFGSDNCYDLKMDILDDIPF